MNPPWRACNVSRTGSPRSTNRATASAALRSRAMVNSPGPVSLDRLLRAIPRILRSKSLEASLTEALELLRLGGGAEAAVLFLADGDAPLREYWATGDPTAKKAFRARLKVEALEAIRRGGPHLTTSDGEILDGLATKTVLLSTDSGPIGSVALAWSSGPAPEDAETSTWITAAIALLAAPAISESEVGKLKNQAERDKRWFKTLAEHLPVLDRDRQKLAAVVNQTATFVFVTHEE